MQFSDLQTELNHGFTFNDLFMLNALSCYEVVILQAEGSLHPCKVQSIAYILQIKN